MSRGDEDNYSYNLDAKELVCSKHFKDSFLKGFILKNGYNAKCNYCGKKRKVVELSEILKLIIVGINCLFEDANESRYYNKDGEHGFDGNTMLFDDLIYGDELGLRINSTALEEDIFKYLYNDQIVYCRKDEFGDEFDYLKGLWDYFQVIVKHQARFVFHYQDTFSNFSYRNPSGILNSVQQDILRFNLFRNVSTKTKLYRCVQHERQRDVKIDGARIRSNPTINCKINNRMSPAGISMFYCSTDKNVCIEEVVDFKNKKSPFYTTAYFLAKKEMKFVDLTKLPPIPSIYDETKNKFIESLYFLKEFIEDLSKPVKLGDEIIDYIPTQIVTEFIKYNPELQVDGIIYPSSKRIGKENFVIFKDHEQSISDLIFINRSKRTVIIL
jgi:hypothetical protein